MKGSKARAFARFDEGTATVEAERSCSSADWGRRILSPGNVLLDLGATLNTPVQEREISDGVAMVCCGGVGSR